VATQVRLSIAAEESWFKINRQVAALSHANPGVSLAFLLLLHAVCVCCWKGVIKRWGRYWCPRQWRLDTPARCSSLGSNRELWDLSTEHGQLQSNRLCCTYNYNNFLVHAVFFGWQESQEKLHSNHRRRLLEMNVGARFPTFPTPSPLPSCPPSPLPSLHPLLSYLSFPCYPSPSCLFPFPFPWPYSYPLNPARRFGGVL